MNGSLLEVRSLAVAYDGIPVLEDVSFEVAVGEAVGLVGESGAGKSTLARALVKLVAARRGALIFRGVDLEQCTGRALRALRRELQIIFQDPFASLDPRMTVGRALLEPLEIFEPRSSRAHRDARIRGALVRVGLGAEMAGRYPRELSGGECQRVAIARALLPHPRLLICDEPVSALDVSIQGQVINLLADLNRREAMALLLISHNIALVRHLCGRIIVLLEGQVLEIAPSERLPGGARHPYTHALVAAVPTLESLSRGLLPATTAGGAGGDARLRRGCVYARRCPHAEDRCRQTRPLLETVGEGHQVACHRWRELSAGGLS
ncbi:MAG TPA: oligopeptide/dipeptide ABC transporter ATP-binding protein [Steroidobacteraceae bacterium]|nr:oligopeptide/dipeptide ABC transporter ATP-binding protein [Steroidobacteraceae bacterium]